MFIGIQNNERIDINNYTSGKVTCPGCGGELVAKKGTINVHHFAHKTLTECDQWYEMSEWHRYWQGKFPEQYREIILEKDNSKHISDVKIDNLCIEFQHSPISITNIKNRNDFYTKFGTLVWLFDVKDVAKNIELGYSNKLEWKWKSKSILSAIENNVHVYLQKSDYTIYRINYLTTKNVYASNLTEENFIDDLRKIYKGIDPRKEIKENTKSSNQKILFGKYKDKTIQYVYKNDKKYLKWVYENCNDILLNQDIDDFLKINNLNLA